VASFVLAFVFAGLITPIVLAHTWLTAGFEVSAGETAPLTVRVPQFTGLSAANGVSLDGGAIVVARGQIVDPPTKSRAALARAAQPTGWAAWIGYFVGLFIIGLLYTSHLRFSHRGRLRRTQAVSVILFILVALAVKAALLFTAVSALAMPIGALALAAALVIDRGTGVATALILAVLIALLSPFDPGVIMVLAAQSVGAVLMLSEGSRGRRIWVAGMAGGIAAMAAYFLFAFLAYGTPPIHEFADPMRSAWLAAGVGGALSGIVAIVLRPALQVLLGDITRNKLVELEDLSHPLLKQIAEKAPGTWQHSLAMANMAEVAANTIGANGRLVRVGAYYHDLGKSLQPKYYIENLGGEASPHDSLPPTVSCDAIFAHVTEGVRVGRKAGLHERIIDFMHMHHGDGLLEYFWAKCQEQGNPDNRRPEH
jgi:putative nucleotidyltransferase with HDIG domain